jgi:hypothetical protein
MMSFVSVGSNEQKQSFDVLLDFLLILLYYGLPFWNKNWEIGILIPIWTIMWDLETEFSFLCLMFFLLIVINLERKSKYTFIYSH